MSTTTENTNDTQTTLPTEGLAKGVAFLVLLAVMYRRWS